MNQEEEVNQEEEQKEEKVKQEEEETRKKAEHLQSALSISREDNLPELREDFPL